MTIKPPAHSPKHRESRDRLFRKLAARTQQTYCGRKRSYESKRRAAMVGMDMVVKTGIEFYTYRCRQCGGWHLTRSEIAAHGVKQKFNVRDVLTGEEK